jgi:hypothetical protein
VKSDPEISIGGFWTQQVQFGVMCLALRGAW